jgi:NitT/TauT family transport system permease protein
MSDGFKQKSVTASLRMKIGWEPALVSGIFIVLLIVSAIIPDNVAHKVTDRNLYLSFIIALLSVYLLGMLIKKSSYRKESDILLVLGVILLVWEAATTKLALLDPFLFPAPAKVFAVFGTDYDTMINGILSSFTILLTGYFLALLVAIPLALLVGWRKRAFDMAYPIAKAVSPIPPTVYLPYAIVLLPTFSSASIFVIFIGAFWPVFVNTVYGVFNIDRRIVNSARALGLKEHVMLRRVILPAALPSIFSGAMISLILAFVTLTVAEMIAATSGLGWYIQYEHEFANYDKMIAGMILMAACVIVVMWVFDRVQKYSLRWQTPQ